MAAVPVAMAVGSQVLQGIGGYMSASAQADAARAQADALGENARINDLQTAARESLQRRQAASVLGEQRAAVAQSGFGTGGTMGDIVGQSVRDAEMDALNIRYEGNIRSTELRGQAEQLRYEAMAGKRAAGIGLGASLLTGAASGYGAYAQTGGTFDKLGYQALGPSNVMRHSAIPGALRQGRSISNSLRGY